MTKKFSEEFKKEILEFYKINPNIQVKEIAKKFNISPSQLSHHAVKAGISRGKGLVSNISSTIFDPLDTSGSYWLGWIISDGNIQKTLRNATISLFTKDEEISKKFKEYIPESNLHFKKESQLYCCYFGSKVLVEKLISFGIVPNKSKIIELTIPLNVSMLRGIFDGDGSVHNKRYVLKITTASIKLAEQMFSFLKENNIKSKIRERHCTPGIYDLWIENKENYIKFFEFIYKNSNENKLLRKYDRFVAMLEN